ncbi:hypothetical protein WA026_008440 [Henosepilachna vigintioctopunctata]|uniref:BESS domain-containing protein n=1 Tax=Henosepilachna vigintioctopunctata TaxID=420089 RepID=A0AAW1UJM4_9CUCU
MVLQSLFHMPQARDYLLFLVAMFLETNNESQETGIRELDDVEDNDGVETSHSGNIPSSQNNNLPKSQGVQKRRSKNPPELQEASKHVSAALNTLNKVLQSKNNKEDNNHDDESNLFGKLMAKQLKDFPKEERDEIMYEIHGLIMQRRRIYEERMLLHGLSPTISNRSSPAQSSYSNESLPKKNICSPESPYTMYTHTSPHTIIGHTSSSGTSYITTTLPQNLAQETEYQTSLVDQQPMLYSHTSPSHIIIMRPSLISCLRHMKKRLKNHNEEMAFINRISLKHNFFTLITCISL